MVTPSPSAAARCEGSTAVRAQHCSMGVWRGYHSLSASTWLPRRPHQRQLIAPGTRHQHLLAVVIKVFAKERNEEIAVGFHVRHRLPADVLVPLWCIVQLMGDGAKLHAAAAACCVSCRSSAALANREDGGELSTAVAYLAIAVADLLMLHKVKPRHPFTQAHMLRDLTRWLLLLLPLDGNVQ